MYRPHKITKEVINRVIGFGAVNELPTLRTIATNLVTHLTMCMIDYGEMIINDTVDLEVLFFVMVIGHRVYQSGRINNVPSGAIHTTYQIVN